MAGLTTRITMIDERPPRLTARSVVRLLRWRRLPHRLSIATVMVGGFGGLVLLAVASVLALGITSAGRNTFALLSDNSDLVLSNVEQRLRQRLDSAERLATYVATGIETADLSPDRPAALEIALRGALALAPDVTGVAYFSNGKSSYRMTRPNGRLETPALPAPTGAEGSAWPDGSPYGLTDKAIRELLDRAGSRTVPVWGSPSWSGLLKTSLVGVAKAAQRDGATLGYAVVGVSLGDLSRFMLQLYAEQGISAFILYDRQHVLAHPTLAALDLDLSRRSSGPPLPRVSEVDDLALAAFGHLAQARGEDWGHGVESFRVGVGSESYLILLRRLSGIGPHDWTIGVSFPEREATREVRRLILALSAGLIILVLSVAIAWYLARRIGGAISQFAAAAERVRSLDFSDTSPMPDSTFTEIARAGMAFNAMLAGLRWFEAYVPKSLVLRLMKRGVHGGDLNSEERVVTVMFTDILGFSDLARSLSPSETQELLAQHFSLLSGCIEAEGGTVDKYIGDAIMAFWGAPDEQPDHAARALRAAAAIAAAAARANRTARLPVRLRVALHTGPVVVGNIGTAARINYTIIGDTVNIAARLEEVGHQFHGDDEDACVLISDDTLTAARIADATITDDLPALVDLGPCALRGRDLPLPAWKLQSNNS